MPVPPQDRPIASVREETIDRLIVNYGHGKLSLEAFERRLDQALDAKSADMLLALTSDFELDVDKQYAQQKRAEFGVPAPQAPQGSHERRVSFMIHIFGGGNRGGAWTVPPQIWMLNLFGGGDVDFSHARFSSPVTHVRMLTLFGGAQFYVNETMNTVSNVFCIFGGMDNRGPSSSDPNAPTVVIEGLCLFGGAGIKVKKTLKERWLAIADHVRAPCITTTDARAPGSARSTTRRSARGSQAGCRSSPAPRRSARRRRSQARSASPRPPPPP
jgi:hypothetical protein